MKQNRNSQQGSANGWMIGAIGALVLFLIAGSLAIWAFVAYSDQKSNVDSKVDVAVATAKQEQSEEDLKKFDEKFKDPRIEFVGPVEYGRVSFMYPKTWSVYIDKDGSDRGDFKAYLHPVAVPPVSSNDSRFALRLEILNSDFDKELAKYAGALKKGDLKSSSVEFNGTSATRIDGAFSKDIRGSVVLLRVRDKTVRFSTDADTFKPDFKAVLDTLALVQ